MSSDRASDGPDQWVIFGSSLLGTLIAAGLAWWLFGPAAAGITILLLFGSASFHAGRRR